MNDYGSHYTWSFGMNNQQFIKLSMKIYKLINFSFINSKLIKIMTVTVIIHFISSRELLISVFVTE